MSEKGKILLFVWNKDQPRFIFSKKEVTIPWNIDGNIYPRYYYLYDSEEFEKELHENNFDIISIKGSKEKAFNLFSRNIVAEVTKRGSPSGQWD